MLAEVENKKQRNTGTLRVNGKTFVLVPASEYRSLIRRAAASDAPLPPKPTPLANGNYDAVTAMRAIIARDRRGCVIGPQGRLWLFAAHLRCHRSSPYLCPNMARRFSLHLPRQNPNSTPGGLSHTL